MEQPPEREPATATIWHALKAVFSAFFGVRRAADHEAVRLRPVHVIIAALIGAAVFVLTLLAIVSLVTR